VGLARGGSAKAGEYALDRCAGSHFAFVVAADSVRQHKKAAMGTHLARSRGIDVAEVVLVVITHSSGVGELREFNLKHSVL
jgi:hypothetical protein